MQRNHQVWSFAKKFVFLVVLGWAVALVRAVRPGPGWDEWSNADGEWSPMPVPEVDEVAPEPETSARRPFVPRRIAMSGALVLVFFAAASFSAGAGDLVAKALDPARCAALMQTTGEDDTVCADLNVDATDVQLPPEAVEALPVVETAPVSEAPAEAVVEPVTEEQSVAAAEVESLLTEVAEPDDFDPAALSGAAQADGSAVSDAEAAPAASSGRYWIVRRAKETKVAAPAVEPEGGATTVWLNRALPDPTPPAKRLSPEFAKQLQKISAVNGVSWALVLGVLRAQGAKDRVPATVKELNALASGLSDRGAAESEWNAVISLSGRTTFADRAVALARYNRAVGLKALVNGLEAEKADLIDALLGDERVTIYAGGREDLLLGRIDVRVVVLLRYLTESYGEVTVSSLFSGHRKYSRPGVISAHTVGHAVDIATVAGISIVGHQEPGSITEKAVRSILMLPVEVQPRQVISLLGLGGPSFPLADHNDHIHVGY